MRCIAPLLPEPSRNTAIGPLTTKKSGGSSSTALKINTSKKGSPQSMQSVVCQNHAKIAMRFAPAKTDRMID